MMRSTRVRRGPKMSRCFLPSRRRMCHRGRVLSGMDGLKSLSTSNFSRGVEELCGDHGLDHAFRRKRGRIGAQPARVALPDGFWGDQRQVLEDANRDQGHIHEPFGGGQGGEHLLPGSVTEVREVWTPPFGTRQGGLHPRPKVVRQTRPPDA